MGSVLSIAQRLGKGFIQMLIRVIDLKSPQLQITGNVNFGTNHGTINQQHFFQNWLDTTHQPPAAIALDAFGRQSEPCEMETFCYIPVHTATASGRVGDQRKEVGGQDERGLSPQSLGDGKAVHDSENVRSQKSIGDAPFVSSCDGESNLLPLDMRRQALRASGDFPVKILEDLESQSKLQEALSTVIAEGKPESNWASNEVDVKKADTETEQAPLVVQLAPSSAGSSKDTQASPDAQQQLQDVTDSLVSPEFEDNLNFRDQLDVNEYPASSRPDLLRDIDASPEDTPCHGFLTTPVITPSDREIPGLDRHKEALRKGFTSTQKKSVIVSAIASIGFGKAKNPPINTEKEKATSLVDDLERELNGLEVFAKQFAKDAVEWTRLTTRAVGALRTWSVSLWKNMSSTLDIESEAFDAFLGVVERQLLPLCVDLEAVLNERLLRGIAHLLETMNQPYKQLAFMHEQEPVHYRYLSTPPKSNFKGNKAYAAMRSTSVSYVALRAQLLEDLPRYIYLLHKGLMISVRCLADIQGRFWKDVRDKWGELWDMLRVDGEINAGFEETINVWSARWMDADEYLSSLNICQAQKIYQEPERGRRRSASRSTDISRRGATDILSSQDPSSVDTHAIFYVPPPMPATPSTRSRSRNSEESLYLRPRRNSSHSKERWPEPKRGRPPTSPGLDSPLRPPLPVAQSKSSAYIPMPSAPNGKPLRPARKSKSHRSAGRDLPIPQTSDPNQLFLPAAAVSWATKPAKYVCQVIHPCTPPSEVSYLSFPFLVLHVGALYEVLHEAGHPDAHPKLPLYVDEGEDCLLLCRNTQGKVGWALASFLEPVD